MNLKDAVDLNRTAVVSTVLPGLGAFVVAESFGINSSVYKKWMQKHNCVKWAPPDWLIGPAWGVVFTSMGYGSCLVFRDGGGFNGAAKLPLLIYGSNLVLNWTFPPICFYYNKLNLAMYHMFLVDATVIASGYLFYGINKTAGLLMLPYVFWMSYCSAFMYRIFKNSTQEKESTE